MSRLLILVGSPRKKGTSYSFTRTLKNLAEASGHQAEILYVIDYLDGRQEFDALRSVIEQSHVVGLVTPMYVDTLPYPVIWFLERLSAGFRDELAGKGFFAVAQCGFPDASLLRPLLESCRCFAATTGMRWMGGLAHGGGAIINGAHLENLGGKGRKITAALSLALEDVLQGKMISDKAQQLMTVRIPRILYRPLAAFLNHRARTTARGLGVTDLAAKPYLD